MIPDYVMYAIFSVCLGAGLGMILSQLTDRPLKLFMKAVSLKQKGDDFE